MPARTSLEWGGGVVGRVAPDVDARLARVCASIWYTPRSEITALMRLRAAQLLRIEDVAYWWTPGAPDIDEDRRADLSTWPTSAVFSDAERACLDFTEQFVIDVSAITRSQRDAVSRHAGSEICSLSSSRSSSWTTSSGAGWFSTACSRRLEDPDGAQRTSVRRRLVPRLRPAGWLAATH